MTTTLELTFNEFAYLTAVTSTRADANPEIKYTESCISVVSFDEGETIITISIGRIADKWESAHVTTLKAPGFITTQTTEMPRMWSGDPETTHTIEI